MKTLNPNETAIFPVSWAGQKESKNWFHIAREYTEKFIHQQQIREAVGKQALLTKELFYPFIETFMQGLPYTYRNEIVETGTTITVKVLSEIGGEWTILKTETEWLITKAINIKANSTVCINPETAWKLFSKGITPTQAYEKVTISRNQKLGETALHLIAVMA